MYLLDTNILIGYLQDTLNANLTQVLDGIGYGNFIISRISYAEVLSWKGATAEQLVILQTWLDAQQVLEVDRAIGLEAATLRRGFPLKLPDALIAATAIANNLNLVSLDRKDFGKIPRLNLADLG